MKPKLKNIRLQKYKRNRMLGMNMRNAARAAGYSESYVLSRAHTLDKAKCVGMSDVLDRIGLTDKVIAEQIKKGILESNKILADGREVPDATSRHRFCETALKLKGKLSDNSLKDLGEVMKPVINIVTAYVRETDANSSRVLHTNEIRFRDLGTPVKVQEHQLAQTGEKDNSSTEQVD